MSYKEGTYKLNLGINAEEKQILDDLNAYYVHKSIADTVRFCIQACDLKNSPSDFVDWGHLLKDLSEIKEELKKMELELKNVGR